MTGGVWAGLVAAVLLGLILGRPPFYKSYIRSRPFACRLFYTDQKNTPRKEHVLYGSILHAPHYDLRGKPDYIYRRLFTGQLLPVELKSGIIQGNTPHEGDLLQLAAYFLIIEDAFGKPPKKGWLVYKNYMFVVRNTPALRQHLLETLDDMRRMLVSGEGEANADFLSCRHCNCRGTVCEFCGEENQ